MPSVTAGTKPSYGLKQRPCVGGTRTSAPQEPEPVQKLSTPLLVAEAGQGNRPLATANPNRTSFVSFSVLLVSFVRRCSTWLLIVGINPDSNNPTIISTTAISTKVKPRPGRSVAACLVEP